MANTLDQGFDYPGFDYAPQRSKIARKRALAQALQQQGMAPLETNRMSGGWAVPISPFEGLAKMAQTYVGGMAGRAAEKDQADLAKTAQGDYQKMLATALSQMDSDPAGAIGTLGTHPQGQQLLPMAIDRLRLVNWLKQYNPQGQGNQAAPQPAQEGYGTVLAPGVGAPTQGQQQGGGLDNPAAWLNAPPGGVAFMQHQAKQKEALGGVQYDQHGNAFVINKAGQPQYLPGITARDKNEFLDTGPAIQPTNPYTGQPGGPPIQKGLAPMQAAELPLKQQAAEIDAAKLYHDTGQRVPRPQPIQQPIPQAPGQPAPAPTPQGRPIPQAPSMGAPVPTQRGAPTPSAQAPTQPLAISPKQRQELEFDRPKQTQAANSSIGAIDRSLSEIDRLLEQPGLEWVTGPIAGRVPAVTGKQTNAQANIDTLKSQIGVATLTAMREASKTGGAVGNVTEKEWPILQNQLGALQQSQTTDEFKKNLAVVRASLARAQKNIRQAYEMTYGKMPSVDPDSGAEVKGIEDRYRAGKINRQQMEDELYQWFLEHPEK